MGRTLRIHPSNLVAVLDRLQAVGLIEREADPADRRRHLLTLSPSGRSRLSEAALVAAEVEADLFEPLSAAERKRMHSMLERLASHSCSSRRDGKPC